MGKSIVERRRHKRLKLSCPVKLASPGGQVLASGKAINISDGGVLVPVTVQSVPRLHGQLHVQFSVPRTTPNTYMLEDFAASARVVRHQPLHDDRLVAIAVQFEQPLALALEV